MCVSTCLYVLLQFVCACVITTVSIISIVWDSQRLASRHHSMSKGIKDDANRCRLAIMKHNYSFIRRCNCFVRASQFVLVVRRLLLPLYNAHAHPYLTCYVICGTLPFSYYSASMESCLYCLCGEKWFLTSNGWFTVKYTEWASRRALRHWQLVSCGITNTTKTL